MSDGELPSPSADAAIEVIRAELEAASPTRRQMIWEAIASAALGSIPWIGGVMAASISLKQDLSSAQQDTLESAFEDTKPWVLTELGGQFVSYAMNELVQRLDATT